MSIVDIINEKTGKFANNIAEAVADLLGHDLKATSIVENIGEGNNIQEALDNISGKSSNNIAEAIDNYYDQEHLGTTISDALERAGDEPGPEPPGPGPEPPGPDPDFDHMTKAELQQYADDNYISGVDQSSQTKAEMIQVITETLDLRILDSELDGRSEQDFTPDRDDFKPNPVSNVRVVLGYSGIAYSFGFDSESEEESWIKYHSSIETADVYITFILNEERKCTTIHTSIGGDMSGDFSGRIIIDPEE